MAAAGRLLADFARCDGDLHEHNQWPDLRAGLVAPSPRVGQRSAVNLTSQIPLQVKLRPYASFASFIPGRNQAAVRHVEAIASGQRSEAAWIHGRASTGKSHLLNAACRAAGEANLRTIYLALNPEHSPEILTQLDGIDVIALDDIHSVAAAPAWEEVLFSVFDRRLQAGGLIVAADLPPHECGFALADLVSRAAAAAVYRLEYLDDQDLERALILQAELRGLSLDQNCAAYLLQRLSRDLRELTAGLDRIDHFALSAKRKITIPLLREAMRL